METSGTDEVICPYCGHNHGCEFDDYEIYTCDDCEKEFNISVKYSRTFSTTRKDCAEGTHEFEEPRRFDYDEKWRAEHPRGKDSDYSIWVRKCKNCEYRHAEETAYKAEMPEEWR